MYINQELTQKYYANYNECKCIACKKFYKEFPKKYPDICSYLESLGINPLKPLELISVYNSELKRMEYHVCLYAVVGYLDEDFNVEINNLKITENLNNHHFINYDESMTILDFGPVYFEMDDPYARELSREEKVKVINNVLIKHDPMGLISMDCPLDEYISEAHFIESAISKKRNYFGLAKIIKGIFEQQFNEELPISICKKIALDLPASFDFEIEKKKLMCINGLEGKVKFTDDYSIIVEFHKDFIMKFCSNEKVYINDKYYTYCESQDILEYIYSILHDENNIFIQFSKNRLLKNNCFKEVKKENFKIDKYKKNKYFEKAFDVNGLLL